MSVRPAWFVWCDVCGDGCEGDQSCQTAQEARDRIKFDGWHTNRPGGKDICADCWADGER